MTVVQYLCPRAKHGEMEGYMKDIVEIQGIISALIAFGSAVIVAILAGIFQLNIAKKNREITKRQIEQSKTEFSLKMQQSQKEYVEKIEQLREEQTKANLEKANDKLQAGTNRFYNELMEEMLIYNRLLNELHYLNVITNLNFEEIQIKGVYPHIDNNIRAIIGNASLHQDIAKLLGTLRANISLYNATLEQGSDIEV